MSWAKIALGKIVSGRIVSGRIALGKIVSGKIALGKIQTMETLEVTPQALQKRLAAGEQVVLIDVREPEEFALTRIDGSELVPMGSVPGQLQRLERLADEQSLMVLCHHGVRSLQVVSWLRARGVENCFSVAGGIDRWSREIDPNLPRY